MYHIFLLSFLILTFYHLPYKYNKISYKRQDKTKLVSRSKQVSFIKQLYEDCLRDSDTFGCCGSYLACSDAGHCIKTDIMFAGKCAYRQNLKAGKIFYGKNKNIWKLCAGKHPCTQFFIALLTLALKFYGILNCSLLLCAGQSPWYWLLPSVQR